MTSLTLNPLTVKNAVSKGLYQSIQNINPIYDTFDRPDIPLNGTLSTSGNATWALAGAGYLTASIANKQFVSPYSASCNVYAYLDNTNLIDHIEGTFNFTGNAIPNQQLTLIADNVCHPAVGIISTMVHLNFGPVVWGLTKRIAGGAFVSVMSGVYNLLTDGTIYKVSMDIDTTTNKITVTTPDGMVHTATDTDIGLGGAINPTAGCIQIINTATSFVGAWNSFALGSSVAPKISASLGSAPMSEITWLKGRSDQGLRGDYHQRIGPCLLGSTAGWFTIATKDTFYTYGMVGKLIISAFETYGFCTWEVDVDTVHSDTNPTVFQRFAAYSGTQVIDQLRLSTSYLVGINLDLHQVVARPTTIVVDFYGYFTPVPLPVIGATVYPTGSKIISINPNIQSIRPIIVGAAADATVGNSSFSSAGTFVIPDECNAYVNTNTATLATFTLTLPVNPVPNQKITFSSAGIITALTIGASAGFSVAGMPTAIAAGSSIGMRLIGTVWYPG